MKTIVIGAPSRVSMNTIMDIYPRHKTVVDKYISMGVVIGIRPLSDFGNMANFKTREAAEHYAKVDRFVLEGIAKWAVIKDWQDNLLKG